MGNELKPCPFCGGEADLVFDTPASAVICNICGARTSWRENSSTGKWSIFWWNKRVEARKEAKKDGK